MIFLIVVYCLISWWLFYLSYSDAYDRHNIPTYQRWLILFVCLFWVPIGILGILATISACIVLSCIKLFEMGQWLFGKGSAR